MMVSSIHCGLWLSISIYAWLLINQCKSARLLLFVQYYPSHAQIISSIGEELQQRGHDVVLLTSSNHQFVKDKNLTDVRYYQTPIRQQDISSCTCTAYQNDDPFLLPCFQVMVNDIKAFSQQKQLLDDLKSQQFDGLICDLLSYLCQVIVRYLNIPIQVDIAAGGIIDPPVSSMFHTPNPPAYIPQIGMIATNKMNLLQRTINFILCYVLAEIGHWWIFYAHLYSKFNLTSLGFATLPRDDDRRSTFLLVNGDFALDYPRPLAPHIKFVGPILAKPVTHLPHPLEVFMTANTNGTLLVTFGTVVTDLNSVYNVSLLFETFAQLPYNVMWSYTGDIPSSFELSKNIQLFKWLPQNDVLGHPNIIGFVTHCGVNSILEASYHGVPIVGLPLAGDQVTYAQKVLSKNSGIILNPKAITKEKLLNAIMKVATDPWIRTNASRLGQLMRNRPNHRTPRQETADWIEFALHCNGGNYLRTEEYQLPWYQLYLIDVFITIAIMLYLLRILLAWLYRWVVIKYDTANCKPSKLKVT